MVRNQTKSSEESEASCEVCNCERLPSKSCFTEGFIFSMLPRLHLPSGMTMKGSLLITLVFISHLTCCVSAWPMLGQRRTFNYAPASVPVAPPAYTDYSDFGDGWAMAEQPKGLLADAYYDLPLFQQQQQIPQDIYDEQIYEDADQDNYPYFGTFVDTEPEEELELEELKHEKPYVYQKRRITSKAATITGTPAHSTSATPSSGTTEATPVVKSTPASTSSKAAAAPVIMKFNGQKEIPMLRPPSPNKSHHNGPEAEAAAEPKISVAQRSPSNEKPSAYDRLRKYLSIDDALKKEYAQRRAAAAASRHQKRSSIITDSDSLTGQLNSLKKKMD